MRSTSLHLALRLVGLVVLGAFASAVFAQPSAAEKPAFEYSLEKSVQIGQFEARKARDLKTSLWHVEILRGSTLLFRSGNGAKSEEDLLFGTFPLLGGAEKQLLIEEYTGEAFCCTYNYVLGLGDSLQVLYSSTQFPVGYGLVPDDINGDGVFELLTTLTRFDNFFNLPHEESPSVRVVFRFDRDTGRYVVGNRDFPDAVLDEIEDAKAYVADLVRQRVEAGSQTPSSRAWRSQYTGAVLTVALSYLYAGKQAEGWNYLLTTYDLEDRDVLIANLRYYLLRCPIFRGVYKDVQEILRSSMQTNE